MLYVSMAVKPCTNTEQYTHYSTVHVMSLTIPTPYHNIIRSTADLPQSTVNRLLFSCTVYVAWTCVGWLV